MLTRQREVFTEFQAFAQFGDGILPGQDGLPFRRPGHPFGERLSADTRAGGAQQFKERGRSKEVKVFRAGVALRQKLLSRNTPALPAAREPVQPAPVEPGKHPGALSGGKDIAVHDKQPRKSPYRQQ